MLAVDLQSDPPAFDEENRIVDSEEVLKMCGSLVRLDINAKVPSEIGNVIRDRTLSAAHTSVIDFLTTQPIRIGEEEVFQYSRVKANLRMAETCLIYLRYFPDKGIILTEDNIASYPSARLCAMIWIDFYHEVLACDEVVNMSLLNDLVIELFTSPKATLNWIRLCDPDRRHEGMTFEATIANVKPAVYYAARLGLPDVVEHLIQEGHPIEFSVRSLFETPLIAASAMGWAEVVSILLKSGADPNQPGKYRNALEAAVVRGSESITRMLLSYGAKLTEHIWDYNSFFGGRRKGLNIEIFKLVVEAGAFPYKTNLDHTLMFKILIYGDSDMETFDRLVHLGGDPMQQDKRGCNSLHYATRGKNIKFTKRMLESGMDVNVTDYNGWSPLHWAVASTDHSTDVIRLLLDNGCDQSIKDRQGDTAVDLMKRFRREEIFEEDKSRVSYLSNIVCDACEIVSGLLPMSVAAETNSAQEACTLQTRKLAPL